MEYLVSEMPEKAYFDNISPKSDVEFFEHPLTSLRPQPFRARIDPPKRYIKPVMLRIRSIQPQISLSATKSAHLSHL